MSAITTTAPSIDVSTAVTTAPATGSGFGHTMTVFYDDYLLPALQATWAFIKTPWGIATLAGAAGITLISIAATTDPAFIGRRIALYIAAVLCFIGAGIALGIGIAQTIAASASASNSGTPATVGVTAQ